MALRINAVGRGKRLSKVFIGKTLSLRPSEQQKTNLELYMRKHNIKKPSIALKKILNELTIEDRPPQLETPSIRERGSSPFSQKELDEASRIAEILAFYPMRIFCPRDRQFYLTETIIEMCKKCEPRMRKECMVHRVPDF